MTALPINIIIEYLGSYCATIPDIKAKSDPYTFEGSSIIPLETASGVGKVNSTQKPKAIGVSGIAKKPNNARLALNKPTYLEGKVNKLQVINIRAEIDTTIKVSLNL
jgi:hypothetical protein